jgi:hypothetical protein
MATDDTNSRIWPGEYSWPDDRTPAQRAFFRAIAKTAPEVLESLRQNILPHYRRICAADREGQSLFSELYPLVWDWAAGHNLISCERFYPPRTGLP